MQIQEIIFHRQSLNMPGTKNFRFDFTLNSINGLKDAKYISNW